MDQQGNSTRRTFTKEFKLDALRLAEIKGVAAAARELGIKETVLYYWRKKIKEDGVQAFPGKGKLKPDDEEVHKLRRQVKDLTEEIQILKKAAIYFANLKK